MKTFYEIKNVYASDFEGKAMIEDVDMKSRTVTGYFSRFGNKDHDEDIVFPGAFTKTIKERGSDGKNIIPHILDHDIHITLKMLSKPKLYEKTDGGFFESSISDTTNGIDTLKLYRDGVINQHSFGFKITRKNEKEGHREILETILYEISTVTLGANENAIFTGFKSFDKPQLIDRYNLLQKCYSNGDYSDEVFPILEAQIKQIEQDLLELIIKEGKKHDTETTAPTVTTVTQPEVEVLVNNIFKHTNMGDNERTTRKIGAVG